MQCVDRIEKAIALLIAVGRMVPLPMGAQTPRRKRRILSQGGFVMKVNAELVLTNVVVRDAKTGELVRGLKQSDFTIYENGKKQQIASIRFSECGHGHAR